jgi:hypothetical protein
MLNVFGEIGCREADKSGSTANDLIGFAKGRLDGIKSYRANYN